MNGFDTNLLLRILLQDDAAQLAIVEMHMSRLAATGERAYICLPVFIEAVFVLHRLKKLSKADVCGALRQVLDSAAFLFEHGDGLRQALNNWQWGKAGFNDYLIGELNHRFGCLQTCTFDRALWTEDPERYKSP